MKSFLINGVPSSVQMDGWWMSDPPKKKRPVRTARETPAFPRLIALAALVIAGDVLTWQAAPGLSLALFGALILVSVWLLAGRRGTLGLLAGMAFFLPLIEHANTLSLSFLLFGLILGASWIALGNIQCLHNLKVGLLRFVQIAPSASVEEVRMVADLAGRQVSTLPKLSINGWALPLGFGLIFAMLLISANPMLAELAHQFDPLAVVQAEHALRLLFWAGLALAAMPFLRAPEMGEQLSRPRPSPRATAPLPALINRGSISRSLALFNAMFAVQTLLDIVYLWGGAGLPDGMSYATYAHRGAYPLLVTALLAGAFALLARPFAAESRFLRIALLGWVAQNVFLVLSSLLRLETYISAYGLTHLRISALIWMALVALGLMLVIVQVLRRKPARWLFSRAALLGLAGLYLCSFLSFSATIARYNLSHNVPLDRAYICTLSHHALPAILAYEQRHGLTLCHGPKITSLEFADWREWGFRDWRLQRSLAALRLGEAQ